MDISGKIAAVGGRMLDGAARILIGAFFQALARHAGAGGEAPSSSWRKWLRLPGGDK
jgi:2-furoyl-CoA dehydrogenase large subunit